MNFMNFNTNSYFTSKDMFNNKIKLQSNIFWLISLKEARKGFWLPARATCCRHSKLHASNDFRMKVKRAQLTGNKNAEQNCENRKYALQETFPFISNVCSVTYPDIFPIYSIRRALLNRNFSGKFIYRNFLYFSFRLF